MDIKKEETNYGNNCNYSIYYSLSMYKLYNGQKTINPLEWGSNDSNGRR